MIRGRPLRALGPALACLACLACLCVPTGCHEDGVQPRERFVSIRLDDSLSRYDSVEVLVLAAGDTADVVGRAWAGPLPAPGDMPPYRLADDEDRSVSIRVRGFEDGELALDMLLSKEGGSQKVASLLPPTPTDTAPAGPPPSTRLKALSILPGVLEPAFDSATTDYVASLAYAESVLTVTPTPVSDSAGLRVDGTRAKAGKASDPIQLRVGQNELTVRVSVGDSVRIYTIRAVRASQPPPVDTVKPGLPGFPGWQFKTTVAVNVVSLGLGTGVVRDFPLLVRFSWENFDFTEAMPDGRDLRFARDGVALKHELARWDIVNEVGEAWVLLDSLRTDSAFRPLDLYWGNPLATVASDPAETFSADAGFKAVWHLSESGQGNPDEYRDATGRYHGMAGGPSYMDASVPPRPPRRVEGAVGHGQNFRFGGRPGVVVVPPAFDPGTAWTVQTWVKAEGTGTLFQKGEGWLASRQRFELQSIGTSRQLWLKREGNDYSTDVYLPQASWLHLTLVNDGANVHFYVDGFLRETTGWTQGSGMGGNFVIGAFDVAGGNNNFNGSLDEIWFSTEQRSAAWIRLAFENQRPESYLVTVTPR